jgi:hypothetical protein
MRQNQKLIMLPGQMEFPTLFVSSVPVLRTFLKLFFSPLSGGLSHYLSKWYQRFACYISSGRLQDVSTCTFIEAKWPVGLKKAGLYSRIKMKNLHSKPT